MPHFGGKNAKKKSSSQSTKRHFTVVIGSKEHGLYVSSSPSSAARKAVSKLCATDKKRKVSFHIREITQGSKKKTYGPYLGYIEKLAKPIELKGRIIRYKPVAKLVKKTGKKSVVKKGGMRGGYNEGETDKSIFFISTSKDYNFLSNFYPCEFTDDEILFKNMEQYFMYQKAKMFDETAIPSILSETDPREIQKLGRTIKNFNDDIWNQHKLDIMYRGLQLKFGQNRDILDKLLETGNKTLYEANKYDRYWGIGCDVETGIKIENGEEIYKNGNPIVFGDNNLGKLLMNLRDSFRVNPSNNSQSYRM
jgi:ribA/ribD-fused uncharacterized protein